MKTKAFIPLALGLVIGLLAVKFGVDAIRKAQASTAPKNTFPVVRAKQDISPHVAITKDMVELVHATDEQFAPARERLDTLEKAVDRVTAKSIPANVPILANMLAPPQTKPGMIGRILPGYRAQSVKISEETAAGYNLQGGNMVDVVAIMDIDMGGRKKERISEIILENVQIAAIGLTQGADQTTSNTGKVKPARSATLLVPVSDAPLLHWANREGEITLALRGDEEVRDGVKKKGGQILAAFDRAQTGGTPAPPPPLALPPTDNKDPEQQVVSVPLPHEVVIYKGGGNGEAVERITFASENSSQVIAESSGGRRGAANTPLHPRGTALQRNAIQPQMRTSPTTSDPKPSAAPSSVQEQPETPEPNLNEDADEQEELGGHSPE